MKSHDVSKIEEKIQKFEEIYKKKKKKEEKINEIDRILGWDRALDFTTDDTLYKLGVNVKNCTQFKLKGFFFGLVVICIFLLIILAIFSIGHKYEWKLSVKIVMTIIVTAPLLYYFGLDCISIIIDECYGYNHKKINNSLSDIKKKYVERD